MMKTYTIRVALHNDEREREERGIEHNVLFVKVMQAEISSEMHNEQYFHTHLSLHASHTCIAITTFDLAKSYQGAC